MNREIVITKRMKLAFEILKELGGQAYVSEVLEYLDITNPDRDRLKTYKDIHTSLAALAGKGLVTVKEGIFREKKATKYITSMDSILDMEERDDLIVIKKWGEK